MAAIRLRALEHPALYRG